MNKLMLVGLLALSPLNAWAAQPAHDDLEMALTAADVSDAAYASAFEGLWKTELEVQLLSWNNELLPMVGPAFAYRTLSMNEFGFRSLFSTSGRNTITNVDLSRLDHHSPSYTGQFFSRFGF